MNLTELDRALRKLRLSGMADVLEARCGTRRPSDSSPLDLVADARRATNCSAGKTGSLIGATNRRASAIPIARSTALISTSTRR